MIATPPLFPRRPRRAPLSTALALAIAAGFGPARAAVPHHDGIHVGEQWHALARQGFGRSRHDPAAARPAGTIVVANCDDSGPGSLRAAIDSAVSGDTIDLTMLSCGTIALASPLETGVYDLALEGPGAGALAIDGGDATRLIAHSGYGTLAISGLTLRNGAYEYGGPGVYGGLAAGACILSSGSVAIADSAIEHCRAEGWSVFGAAIDVGGMLELTDSTITGTIANADASEISSTVYGGVAYARAAYLENATIDGADISSTTTSAFAGLLGGGLFGFYGAVLTDSRISGITAHVAGSKDSYAKGGAIGTPNAVLLTRSTISGNSVHGAPGVGASGAYVYTSAVGGGGIYIVASPHMTAVQSSIVDSTISGNSAIVDGDAGDYTVGGGGGLVSWSAYSIEITNSTLSGNWSSLHGGAIYTRHRGGVVLRNATITDNTAPDGAGIADLGEESVYDLDTVSSLVAGNHATAAGANEIVTAHAITGSHNLIASADVALPPDTIGGDPMLGPLADNGGATLTHALLAGSPAIDAGDNPLALANDQRGEGHARVEGAAADIGAFEFAADGDAIFANGFE